MKILVTGDRGFVGTETRKFLEALRIPTSGYDLMDNRDIRDFPQLEAVVKEESITRIIHLAAVARFAEADKDPLLALETNVLGTKNIAAISAKYHIPVVYASTGSIYMPIEEEPPITEDFKAQGNSVYGCTKRQGELYIQRFAHPWIILRYAHLYGKEKRHHGLIGGFLERINRGLAPTLYGGKQSNDFTYITDIARANYLAVIAHWDAWNQIYNIGTGEEITTERAGEIICKHFGYKGEIKKKEQRTVDPKRFVYDVSRAERMLNFKADYSFEKGIKELAEELNLSQ